MLLNSENAEITNVFIENAQLETGSISDDSVITAKSISLAKDKIIIGNLTNATITGVTLPGVMIGADDPSGPIWKGKVADQEFKLENPGYFDVGVGFTYLGKVHNNPAATGLLATIKAYPCGRWYALRKKPSAANVMKKRWEADASNSDPAKKAAASLALDDYLSYQADLFPLTTPDRDHWYNKFSVFYGHSIGNYDEANIPKAVNAIGIELDIAPEFAFMVGAATYQSGTVGNASETKLSWIIGVQMNTNAFNAFRSWGGN